MFETIKLAGGQQWLTWYETKITSQSVAKSVPLLSNPRAALATSHGAVAQATFTSCCDFKLGGSGVT